ncbi:MAG: ribosome-binding factor A [Hydrogenophilales bacterium CG03_land_8_20_14_0_80_62_28]|nr:30S ribosome-binding factor RbfA [Betaproteobacteria bacterium]OIO79348.1 MAG: ribosome-binding factor A [Hydrogenophilaceae bacterium CG1_02_62_390]PIV21769.1 MAG: ribosome-binding factor A [Hydrogenophilales bacterium CG03_land_8_20_14_0_80_62_28]PIW37664.1 MAG: ribosome-binding factor A [Hydrogenophilales bacterium CG15_BIG_FIL_POST_REV_8_21_14_020_62_31]PIW72941.1 MAG: ribosome-binding factor A [Hydrogenophilales bacterium CG12_big_fil_rev_8_21_14_0_65_61_21]PIX01278.1 MAG: ribosome-bin
MPTDFPRSRRVAEQLRHELADILWREIQDPRIKGMTLTAVEMTSDLEHAKVWFTLLTGETPEVIKGLQSATGFLRRELGRRMRLRLVPSLDFIYDQSVERGAHLSQLIDAAVEEDKRHHQDDPAETDH